MRILKTTLLCLLVGGPVGAQSPEVSTSFLNYKVRAQDLRLGYHVHFLEQDVLLGITSLKKGLESDADQKEKSSLPHAKSSADQVLRSSSQGISTPAVPASSLEEKPVPSLPLRQSPYLACLKTAEPVLLTFLKDPKNPQSIAHVQSLRGNRSGRNVLGLICGEFLGLDAVAQYPLDELKIVKTFLNSRRSFDEIYNQLYRALDPRAAVANRFVEMSYLRYLGLETVQQNIKALSFADFLREFYPQLTVTDLRPGEIHAPR